MPSLTATDPTAEVPCWHFTGDRLRDGSPIPAVGEWLRHEGPIVICQSGLHASERLIDALSFAPGDKLHRCTVRGVEGREADKLVACERRIDWSLDAKPVLRAFARRCALDVLPLWPGAPDVVRQYLETGAEDLRASASAATPPPEAAAWTVSAAARAARDAAWTVSAAARAARDAAWAVSAAARAARDAAWDAAWDAARAAARAAAWTVSAAARAARDAAWTVSAAARAAARAAKISTYDGWLTEMVEAARAEAS